MSGTFDAYLKYGDFFSYTNSPRSQIFRRDHSKVVDLDSMIKIMRYNKYFFHLFISNNYQFLTDFF